MHYIPQTPFRRAASGGVPKRQALPTAAADPARDRGDSVDKWQVLRDLGQARKSFGLSDRDLVVLGALVSFHPAKVLTLGGDLVVHPANATICARLNGMACSTMRRHLARLVESGLILRRDSPNGKRYARRSVAGKVAYGFDLTPLIYLAVQLSEMAQEARADEAATRTLRERVSLMRRDVKTCAQAADVTPALRDRLCALADECARALRRKMTLAELEIWEDSLMAALRDLQTDMLRATEMSTNAAENGQHHKSPIQDFISSSDAAFANDPSNARNGDRQDFVEDQPETGIFAKTASAPSPAQIRTEDRDAQTAKHAFSSDGQPHQMICQDVENRLPHPSHPIGTGVSVAVIAEKSDADRPARTIPLPQRSRAGGEAQACPGTANRRSIADADAVSGPAGVSILAKHPHIWQRTDAPPPFPQTVRHPGTAPLSAHGLFPTQTPYHPANRKVHSCELRQTAACLDGLVPPRLHHGDKLRIGGHC